MALTLIPSIDLRAGRVVRLQQGDYARQIDYDVAPLQTARSFAAAGARWMHLVDLDGAREGSLVQTDLIADLIAASGLQVQVGGGIRSTSDVQRFLGVGAARVVIGTKALEDWAWFKAICHDSEFTNKLVLAVDAREGIIATRGWTQSSGRLAVDVGHEVSDWPLAGLLYTDVSRDGMMQGPNFDQTRLLAESTRAPVIASGGVGSLDHIRQLTQLPVWGAIVGRSIYEGAIDLREALRVARGE